MDRKDDHENDGDTTSVGHITRGVADRWLRRRAYLTNRDDKRRYDVRQAQLTRAVASTQHQQRRMRSAAYTKFTDATADAVSNVALLLAYALDLPPSHTDCGLAN